MLPHQQDPMELRERKDHLYLVVVVSIDEAILEMKHVLFRGTGSLELQYC